jgi:sugar O-acyltransferase (sialic acid O-acetyltransferase NeuD family)
MLFYGASGHGKVVIESWLLAGGKVTGVFDDDATRQRILGFELTGKYRADFSPASALVISIGANDIRKKLSGLIQHEYGNVIHPKSILSVSVKLGIGTVVMAGAIVNAETVSGNHVIINTGAVVDHDCVLGDFTHIAPGATLCGGVHVGEGTLVGAGAAILPGRKVGQWAVVGAGAIVTQDVPDFATVVGNPARMINAAGS